VSSPGLFTFWALLNLKVPKRNQKYSESSSFNFKQGEEEMPYTYSKVDDLEDTPVVGSHQCVALVQHYAKAPVTSVWRQG
jgi:hypothetical protein